MHAPLLVRAPGIKGGVTTKRLVEFIDIYPSLCDLAGLDKPEHLEGRSFVPLLSSPEMPWKSAAIGRFRDGDTIRTDQYRFTQYSNRNGEPTARMMYDHQADPLENHNIAEKDRVSGVVRSISQSLQENMGHDPE